jgi:hypothetical protein
LPTLEVADVVRLVEAGVDDQVITRFINKRRPAAALTAEDLILLTKSGTSVQVITALQAYYVAPKASQKKTTDDY